MEYNINTVNSIADLKICLKQGDAKFRLDLPFLSEDENNTYTIKFINNIKACGCTQGRVGATFGAFLFLCCFMFFEEVLPFNHIAYNIILCLLSGAIVGKITGKIYAVIQNKIFAKELQKIKVKYHQ